MGLARCHRIVGKLPQAWERLLSKADGAEARAVQQPSLLKRVQEMLGLRRLCSDQDLVDLVEERLAIGVVEELRRSGFTDDEIYSHIVPRRTLTHRRARHEALSREESDRAVRIARIAALGEQVFGEAERSWHWLRAAKQQFNGRSPLRLAATEAGARLVEELLYRIDEGMAA
jgi:putative toxin-antitoxin system antitoxin component (TIGR02293 family)